MNLDQLAAFKKRGFDIVVATSLLLLLSPVLAFLWIAIKLSNPRAPAIFTQTRIGWWGQPFKICKFRTMHWDPEAVFRPCSHHDTRVTRLGRGLRAFKLDELPQLWNVLMGKMSVVGPRPFHEQEDPALWLRRSIKPGMTGWAKLHRQPHPAIYEPAYDLQFTGWRHSVLLDLWIIALTPFALLGHTESETESLDSPIAITVQSQPTHERFDVRVAAGS